MIARRWLLAPADWLDRHPRRLGPALIGPAVLFLTLVVGGALLLAVYLSFTDSAAGSFTGRFVGWRNFERALSDPEFRNALGEDWVREEPALPALPCGALQEQQVRQGPELALRHPDAPVFLDA